MGFPILVRRHLYIESGPWFLLEWSSWHGLVIRFLWDVICTYPCPVFKVNRQELNPMMTSSNGNIFRVIGPLCGGIHRSSVNSPHKGHWSGALMFSLILTWINGWENNREAGDMIRHCAHYDVTVMLLIPQPVVTGFLAAAGINVWLGVGSLVVEPRGAPNELPTSAGAYCQFIFFF